MMFYLKKLYEIKKNSSPLFFRSIGILYFVNFSRMAKAIIPIGP
jgi:hypothetical protein